MRMCMEIVKNVLTFGFTLWGLIIAGMGLSTWKKQIKGAKNFEISYSLHYSILKLRDAIKYVRNPVIWPSENYQAAIFFKNKFPDKTDKEIPKQDTNSYVYEMRWEKITKAYTEVESHLLGAEVLWGPDILAKIKPLNQHVNKLNICLRQYFNPDLRTYDFNELHDIIHGDINDNHDAFSQLVAGSIEQVVGYIKEKSK